MKAVWIPGDRLLAVLERADIDMTESERKLCSDLRTGHQEFVSLERADRILSRLDLNHFWHIPKDAGGLADIYEEGAQYGEPNRVAPPAGGPWRGKYKTHEERLAARRETWRRKYQRDKQRRAA